jgi:hypothetical protein
MVSNRSRSRINFQNRVCSMFIASFKHHSKGRYIGNILELKSNSHYDYI